MAVEADLALRVFDLHLDPHDGLLVFDGNEGDGDSFGGLLAAGFELVEAKTEHLARTERPDGAFQKSDARGGAIGAGGVDVDLDGASAGNLDAPLSVHRVGELL